MSRKRMSFKFLALFRDFLNRIARNGVLLVTLLALMLAVLGVALVLARTEVASTIAAISTFFAAISAVASLITVIELKEQRENQERPYVLAHFDVDRGNAIDFIVRNVGRSPAINVRVQFDRAFMINGEEDLNTLSFLKEPIRYLAPGQQVRRFIGTGPQILRRETKYQCLISYKSVEDRQYQESNEGDLAYLFDANIPRKSTSEAVEEVAKYLDRISRTIERVESLGALVVTTPEKDKQRIDDMISRKSRRNIANIKLYWQKFLDSLLNLIRPIRG